MKKDAIMEYVFVIVLCCILFFNLFVLNIFNNKYVFLIFLSIYLIICKKFVESRKISNKNKNKIIFLVIIFSSIYVGFLYLIGIYAGFYINPTGFSTKTLFNKLLPEALIIIIAELIRYIFVTRNRKKTTIFVTIALILIDITLSINLYKIFNLEEILSLIGFVIISSISINIFGNYMVKEYGYIPNMIYKLITTMYIYIFAILPDIYIFFQTLLKIIYPYILYLIIDFAFARDRFKLALQHKSTNIVGLIITIIISVCVVLLISCKFIYGIMVVGSSSMAPNVNKGDAIIFKQYDKQELEKGTVIIFKMNNITTIHRIVEKQVVNDEIVYYTQGDNNQQRDEEYRTNNDIIGVVKFKISYIGWPTLWVNEFFTNKSN